MALVARTPTGGFMEGDATRVGMLLYAPANQVFEGHNGAGPVRPLSDGKAL